MSLVTASAPAPRKLVCPKSDSSYDYTALYTCLAEGSLSQIVASLRKFSVYNLSALDRMVVLDSCLTALATGKQAANIEAVEAVMQEWLPPEDTDIDLFIGEMAAIPSVSIYSIAYLLEIYGDIAPEEVLRLDLETNTDARMFSFPIVASRLEQAIAVCVNKRELQLRQDSWRRLLDVARQVEKASAIAFINNKLTVRREASKPTYLKQTVPRIRKSKLTNSTTRDRAALLVERMLPQVAESSPLREQFSKIIATLTQEELGSIVDHFEPEAELVLDADLLEGPENPRYLLGKLEPCLGAPTERASKGCRMLTCICISEDPEDENWRLEQLAWFRGSCEACGVKLTQACHSVRLPLDKGGWSGCFCSPKCAINTANENIHLYFVGDSDSLERYRNANRLLALVLAKGILEQDDAALCGNTKPELRTELETKREVMLTEEEKACLSKQGLLAAGEVIAEVNSLSKEEEAELNLRSDSEAEEEEEEEEEEEAFSDAEEEEDPEFAAALVEEGLLRQLNSTGQGLASIREEPEVRIRVANGSSLA